MKWQQLLLDTVAHLPELKILRVCTTVRDGLVNFKPTRGLRYVEELTIDFEEYVLEKDEERPVRYREITDPNNVV
jgi:hypothetical protein